MTSEKQCCVPNCRTSSKALHRFPNPDKEPDRFRTWLYVIGQIDILALDNLRIFKNRRVCHLHFENQYHTRNNRISCNAIPTLRLPGSVTNIAKQRVIQAEAHAIEDIGIIEHDSDSVTDNTKLTVDYNYLVDADVDQEIYDGVPGYKNWRSTCRTRAPRVPYKLQTHVKRPKEDGPFSWQKFSEDVVPLDEKRCADDVTFVGESQLVPDFCGPEEIQSHGEFSCNVCNEPIAGFRYACVQCADWDLCGACEARGEHATHYVLRVPPHRTPKETQAVLAALRQIVEGLAMHEDPNVAVIKDEGNREDPLCEEVQREASADTLATSDEEMYEVEYLETESEACMSLGEDFTTFPPTDADCATRQKRKLDACRSYTNRRKAQKHDDRSLKVPESILTKVYSAPQRKSYGSIAQHIVTNNVVELDLGTSDLIALDIETGRITATSKLKQNQKLIALQTSMETRGGRR